MEKRIRMIWIILGVAAVILIVIWILTSRVKKDAPKDTRLFETLGEGIRNLQNRSINNANLPLPQQ